jgi:hypothetical protein
MKLSIKFRRTEINVRKLEGLSKIQMSWNMKNGPFNIIIVFPSFEPKSSTWVA